MHILRQTLRKSYSPMQFKLRRFYSISQWTVAILFGCTQAPYKASCKKQWLKSSFTIHKGKKPEEMLKISSIDALRPRPSQANEEMAARALVYIHAASRPVVICAMWLCWTRWLAGAVRKRRATQTGPTNCCAGGLFCAFFSSEACLPANATNGHLKFTHCMPIIPTDRQTNVILPL